MSKITNGGKESSEKNLEENINRLKEIQDILSDGKTSLTDSMPLLREASEIKKKVEVELEKIENELILLEGADD